MYSFHKLTVCLILVLACFDVNAQSDKRLSNKELETLQHYQIPLFNEIGNRIPYSQQYGKSIRIQVPTPSSINNFTKVSSICQDTSSRFFLRNDTLTYYPKSPVVTADGNLLISGIYFVRLPPFNKNRAFLMKCTPAGDVIWNKAYDSLNQVSQGFINYLKILELQDGSIVLGGVSGYAPNGNVQLLLTKTDPTGNIIWSKIYTSRLWGNGSGSSDYYFLQQLKQDSSSGDIYLAGSFNYNFGSSLMRINKANGNIVWSKAYHSMNAEQTFGLDIKANEIRLFNKASGTYSTFEVVRRINKASGDTIQSKFFKNDDTAANKLMIVGANSDLEILNNGHYVISGGCANDLNFGWDGVTPLYHAAVKELDSNLNFVRAYAFKNNILSNYYNTRLSIFPDGTGVFKMLHYISSYSGDDYTIQFNGNQILKQRKKHLSGEGVPYEPEMVRLPDGADMLVRLLGDTISGIPKIEFLRLHTFDSSSFCLGYTDNSTFIYPFSCSPIQLSSDSVRSNVFNEITNKTITAGNFEYYKLPACYQISNCDSLKLIPSSSAICQSQTLQIKGRKNLACGNPISWQYNNAPVSSVTQINDSTISITFNAPWTGYIYGSLQGCNTIIDSTFISVLQAPIALNLGPDTSICPGNTIILNAHSGYLTYTWQNGSSDSTFAVTQPGTYYVRTTDACGGIFRDTIIVNAHSPGPLSIGPDRTKCNQDTIHLNATAGFIQYIWSPAYNISSANGAGVIVNPIVDTSYFVKAEEIPGCFSYDTVHITVHNSPPINLGIDTSFCIGQSLNLNAGAGFINYLWNTGTINSQITVSTVGLYSIVATTQQGCKSYDTLRINNVYPLPVVTLDKNPVLCLGTIKSLDAGLFSAYRWQDGSVNRNLVVNTIGTYYVQVTDNNGCKGSDTSKINFTAPSPTNFLPADTSMCSYGTLSLESLNNYSSYLWNTGNTTSAILVSQPGTYWLETKDNNNCKGRDSVLIQLKQCTTGLYVPSAFSPNFDGANDSYRALLFGNVIKFNFKIYNRFGQGIFESQDQYKGWDGKYKGIEQVRGVYVWICSYQLSGENEKTAKGSFVLLK